MQTIQDGHAQCTVNAVVTTSEFYVPLVAQVATALGLPGLTPLLHRPAGISPAPAKAECCTGLLTPDFYLVHSSEKKPQ